MDILCKQEFVQTIVIMEPWGSRPSCAGSFATLIRGLVVRTGADGSRRSLRRLMNYDNVAPEGKSLLQYLLGCADTEFGAMKEEDGERPVIVADCDHTSFSSAVLTLTDTCSGYYFYDLLYSPTLPLTEDVSTDLATFSVKEAPQLVKTHGFSAHG